MTYTEQEWADGPFGGTPINAERLAHLEAGIRTATEAAATAQAAAAAAQAAAEAATGSATAAAQQASAAELVALEAQSTAATIQPINDHALGHVVLYNTDQPSVVGPFEQHQVAMAPIPYPWPSAVPNPRGLYGWIDNTPNLTEGGEKTPFVASGGQGWTGVRPKQSGLFVITSVMMRWRNAAGTGLGDAGLRPIITCYGQAQEITPRYGSEVIEEDGITRQVRAYSGLFNVLNPGPPPYDGPGLAGLPFPLTRHSLADTTGWPMLWTYVYGGNFTLVDLQIGLYRLMAWGPEDA